MVIYQKKISFTSRRCWIDRSAQVCMHQPKSLSCAIPSLLRERCPFLLPHETSIAQSLRFLNQWETVNQIVPRQAPERLEVHVPVAGMPAPAILAPMHGKAHRTCYVEMQYVESFMVSRYPCDQTSIFVTQLKPTVPNVRIVSEFIQFP